MWRGVREKEANKEKNKDGIKQGKDEWGVHCQ